MRDFDLAELAHPLLPFLLLVQQFAFARHVPAIAFGRNILAHGAERFAGDHLAPDGGLQGDLEQLPGNQILQGCTIIARASTGSALIRIETLTRSPSRYSVIS